MNTYVVNRYNVPTPGATAQLITFDDATVRQFTAFNKNTKVMFMSVTEGGIFMTVDRNTPKKVASKITIHPYIFTDRSIYRPGQTVYFKAFVIKKQGTTSKVFKNEYVKITFHDVNKQVVKTLHVKLNEYGSVAGKFIIPNTGLTGQFSIKIAPSSEYIAICM